MVYIANMGTKAAPYFNKVIVAPNKPVRRFIWFCDSWSKIRNVRYNEVIAMAKAQIK